MVIKFEIKYDPDYNSKELYIMTIHEDNVANSPHRTYTDRFITYELALTFIGAYIRNEIGPHHIDVEGTVFI